jgi:hypothetical protein
VCLALVFVFRSLHAEQSLGSRHLRLVSRTVKDCFPEAVCWSYYASAFALEILFSAFMWARQSSHSEGRGASSSSHSNEGRLVRLRAGGPGARGPPAARGGRPWGRRTAVRFGSGDARPGKCRGMVVLSPCPRGCRGTHGRQPAGRPSDIGTRARKPKNMGITKAATRRARPGRVAICPPIAAQSSNTNNKKKVWRLCLSL